MTTDVLSPPDARPERLRPLRKGWAQEILAQRAGKPSGASPRRAPAMARLAASGPPARRGADAETASLIGAGRRAVRLSLPKPRSG